MKLRSTRFIAASACPVGLSGSAKSAMSGSAEPPSITSNGRSRRLAGVGPGSSVGFSKPSRVPSTLRSRRIRKRAMAARIMIWIICEPIGQPFTFPTEASGARWFSSLCRDSRGVSPLEDPETRRATVAFWLPLLFIGLPIAEIAIFIMVGGAIGVLPTIALVVLAAIAGIAVVRVQGLQTLGRLQASLDVGGDPDRPARARGADRHRRHPALHSGLPHRRRRPPAARARGPLDADPPRRGAHDGPRLDLRPRGAPATAAAGHDRGRLRDRRRRRSAPRQLRLDAPGLLTVAILRGRRVVGAGRAC